MNGRIEVAGPKRYRMDDFYRQVLKDDPAEVVTDPQTVYYGIDPGETSLVPLGADVLQGKTGYEDWLGR